MNWVPFVRTYSVYFALLIVLFFIHKYTTHEIDAIKEEKAQSSRIERLEKEVLVLEQEVLKLHHEDSCEDCKIKCKK